MNKLTSPLTALKPLSLPLSLSMVHFSKPFASHQESLC